MKIPVVTGIIDRRILVNYRADPKVVARLLPQPFKPKLCGDFAMVGICLIRLKQIRPKGFPAWIGVSSENAAHRTAVTWDEGRREGVYVRRRDSNFWFNTLAGGRLFPGLHHHAKFTVNETADRLEVAVDSNDKEIKMLVRAHLAETLPTTSLFKSMDEASEFFQAGSMGYSASKSPDKFQGLELSCWNWKVEPLAVDEVRSSFFDDRSVFPAGSIEFDCALLMRDIQHEWTGKPDLCV